MAFFVFRHLRVGCLFHSETVLVTLLFISHLKEANSLTPQPGDIVANKKPEQQVNGDYLALSDVGPSEQPSEARKFRFLPSEFLDFCRDGECINGDVIKVVSVLAKRILGDARLMGYRTFVVNSSESEGRALGAGKYDNRPFTGNEFHDDSRRRERFEDDPYADANARMRHRFAPLPEGSDGGQNNGGGASNLNGIIAEERDDGYDGGEHYGDKGYGGYGGGGGSYGGGGYGGGYGYGGGGSYGGYGDYGCCDSNRLLPILLVGLLALLGFFLYIRSTTTAATGRRKLDEYDLYDVMLDGPTWLSMVHELWEQDDSPENIACIQETLCRMNRLALSAPGQAGWAVSLSSLPLSYLLHARHTGGFTSYIDAALMGRSGANCTELYSSCPRLRY